jgi:hypothetical protein
VYSNRAERFRIQTSIAAVPKTEGPQRRFPGITRDISRTGVYFYVNSRPPEESLLQLLLTLPPEVTQAGSIPAICSARVVRVEPGGPGNRFGVAVEIESWQPLAPANR